MSATAILLSGLDPSSGHSAQALLSFCLPVRRGMGTESRKSREKELGSVLFNINIQSLFSITYRFLGTEFWSFFWYQIDSVPMPLRTGSVCDQ
jgi:hypothetical protein